MSSDTKILIPFDTLENHLHCSICLSVIRGAVLTPCGHRYCSKCITEWVGRNHTCPCCNSTLNASQFYYDVQFDSLTDEMLQERDKAEQAHFDKMFSQVSDSEDSNSNKSPFEEILKKHLKSSLMSHQKYFDKLESEYNRKMNMLAAGLNTSTVIDDEPVGDNSDTLKETLRIKLEESKRLAAEAFDRYLTNNVPSLEILPVRVSVYIPDKDIRVTEITIKPSDSLTVIKPHVESALRDRGDEIISWSDDEGVRLLVGPLSTSAQYNITDMMNNLQNMEDVHVIPWSCRPIFQHNMRPGSEIILQGVFKAQSDMPKRCFANLYKNDGTQQVDYYFCSKCNVKWICKSCIQCCHKGHNISPFVMNHKPTWACCYCPKKKLCQIQDR